MKPGAALINIARGSVVDWDAMIRALKNGELRAFLYRRDFAGAVARRAS